jgi:hypothetical protein
MIPPIKTFSPVFTLRRVEMLSSCSDDCEGVGDGLAVGSGEGLGDVEGVAEGEALGLGVGVGVAVAVGVGVGVITVTTVTVAGGVNSDELPSKSLAAAVSRLPALMRRAAALPRFFCLVPGVPPA